MSEPTVRRPAGAGQAAGISHTPSPFPFGDTVDRLTEAIRAAGATLFAIVDHSGEAERAGLSLRPTKLVIFGSPVAGTPVMVAAPLAALDLPLKVLVWEDADGAVWMSHLDAAWLEDPADGQNFVCSPPVRAESEMVLMTRPRRSMTSGSAARVTLMVPTSVMPITRSTSAGAVSLNSLTTQAAALFTSIEIGPSSDRSVAMAAWIESGSPISIWRGSALPPVPRMVSATRVADS